MTIMCIFCSLFGFGFFLGIQLLPRRFTELGQLYNFIFIVSLGRSVSKKAEKWGFQLQQCKEVSNSSTPQIILKLDKTGEENLKKKQPHQGSRNFPNRDDKLEGFVSTAEAQGSNTDRLWPSCPHSSVLAPVPTAKNQLENSSFLPRESKRLDTGTESWFSESDVVDTVNKNKWAQLLVLLGKIKCCIGSYQKNAWTKFSALPDGGCRLSQSEQEEGDHGDGRAEDRPPRGDPKTYLGLGRLERTAPENQLQLWACSQPAREHTTETEASWTVGVRGHG